MAKKRTSKKTTRKKTPRKKAEPKKAVPKRKHRGREKVFTDEEVGLRQKEAKSRYSRRVTSKANEIAPFPIDSINWERRAACRVDLRLFSETYLSNIFYYGWSDDQLRCVEKVERVFTEGGMFAVAQPRGGGKTAICRSGTLWGTLYGYRRYPIIVGATDPKGQESLEAIRIYLYQSQLLLQDFPEICYPVMKLENRPQAAYSQTFDGFPTHIQWGKENVQYPCLLLPKEIAEIYEKHGEKLIYLEQYDRYITRSAGTRINTYGIKGSIRGEAGTHPLTLAQPRPDVVILDDVQNDEKAESKTSKDKIIRLVEGAISGLAGPGRHIAAIMPCTVIIEDDVADTFLNPLKKPDWQPERCRMVLSWPEGINDFEISLDTEPGRLWMQYDELRRKSLLQKGNIALATEFYVNNRKEMDEGFIVSWNERYDREGAMIEVSAQQHAMNLRFKSPDSFGPEFQNRGRKLVEEGEILITAGQLAKKTTALKRNECPSDGVINTCFVDVQNEILFWTMLSVSTEFTGAVINYGTFPERQARYFTKSQTESWGMLTSLFFNDYPQYKDKGYRTAAGRLRAPLEAKIYHALKKCFEYLQNIKIHRTGPDGILEPVEIDLYGVDCQWGKVSDVIKRFIVESGNRGVIAPYHGQSLPPTYRQFEEQKITKGWVFEHQVNREVKECKWIEKPGQGDGLRHINADVDRMKDFAFHRLATPSGSPGSVTLFEADHMSHEMFADHVCASEYPEPLTGRGMTKNQWKLKENRPDNDFLDCIVGTMVLASRRGAAIRPGGEQVKKTTSKRKLGDVIRGRKKSA